LIHFYKRHEDSIVSNLDELSDIPEACKDRS